MGPISPYSTSKEFGKLTEDDILRESEKFIRQQSLCQSTDQVYKTLRWIIAKINIYGHRHLLDHIRHTEDKAKKIQYFLQWKSLNFQNLDLLFQNLIRRKIMRIDEQQTFTKVQVHQKYSSENRIIGKQIYQHGEQLIRKRKVAVIIYVGSTATKCEESFHKQFYKPEPSEKCLFEMMMQRLEWIGDTYGFPPTYIFYNANSYGQIVEFLKTYKYAQYIQISIQNTHPILNLNGNLCLKDFSSGDVIELPNGSGDFYHCSIKRVNILQKLKLDNVEYISFADCENMLEMVIDPYTVGLLDKHKNEYELMYKCTYSENQREKIFRRIVLQNNAPKADTITGLFSYMNYGNKNRVKNNQNVYSSPVWMNSLVFNLQKVSAILKSSNTVETFPQTVTYTMKYMNYYSPIDDKAHEHESCYVFERQISDLLINNLFRSHAIMVERQEEYLPVITMNKEYSWDDAYKEYKEKFAKGINVPFYQRFKPTEEEEKDRRRESIITELAQTGNQQGNNHHHQEQHEHQEHKEHQQHHQKHEKKQYQQQTEQKSELKQGQEKQTKGKEGIQNEKQQAI